MNRCVVWPRRGTVDGAYWNRQQTTDVTISPIAQPPSGETLTFMQLLNHTHVQLFLRTCVVPPHLSSVPMFRREKLRGFGAGVRFPRGNWTPAVPPPSVSISMAKSLRTVSRLWPSFSHTNKSADGRDKATEGECFRGKQGGKRLALMREGGCNDPS